VDVDLTVEPDGPRFRFPLCACGFAPRNLF
jgi:hypothetical protein